MRFNVSNNNPSPTINHTTTGKPHHDNTLIRHDNIHIKEFHTQAF